MIGVRRLKAVQGRSDEGFAFVAPAPDLSGEPGIRIAECVAAEQLRRAGKVQVVLTFETEDEELGRLWCEVPSTLTSGCRYMRLVTLALDEAPKRGAPIHPGTVFKNKRFKVKVGYRRTEAAKGKGAAREELSQKKKDDKDFLRVLEIVELLS